MILNQFGTFRNHRNWTSRRHINQRTCSRTKTTIGIKIIQSKAHNNASGHGDSERTPKNGTITLPPYSETAEQTICYWQKVRANHRLLDDTVKFRLLTWASHDQKALCLARSLKVLRSLGRGLGGVFSRTFESYFSKSDQFIIRYEAS